MKLAIVVNGQHTQVSADKQKPLHCVMPGALSKAGYEGSPPCNWELRDEHGTLLDPTKKIFHFHFPTNTTLYLNLRPGVGG